VALGVVEGRERLKSAFEMDRPRDVEEAARRVQWTLAVVAWRSLEERPNGSRRTLVVGIPVESAPRIRRHTIVFPVGSASEHALEVFVGGTSLIEDDGLFAS